MRILPVALFALLLARPALAGDATGHTAAMARSLTEVQPQYAKGVGAPKVAGTAQQGRFVFPSITTQNCPYSTTAKFGDGSCAYADAMGAAINEPDDWACIDRRQPKPLNELNSVRLPPVSLSLAEGLSSINADKGAVICNWTHFTNNPAAPTDVAGATKVSLDLANLITDTIEQKGGGQPYVCGQQEFAEYNRRVANSLHFTQDSASEDHKDGNLICTPQEAMFTWSNAFSFTPYSTCGVFLLETAQSIQAAAGDTPVIDCDDAVVAHQADGSVQLSSDMKGVVAACAASSTLACMGFERVLRHHCHIDPDKTVDCAGPPDDHSKNPNYCEGEINFTGSQQDFVSAAVAVTKPVLVKAADRWATVCKEPDDPCVSAQCDTWCKRLISNSVGGYCTNGNPDAKCVLHTCQCLLPTECGGAGQACCQPGNSCTNPSQECGLSTGTCVARGTDSCNVTVVSIAPSSKQLAKGASLPLVAAITEGGTAANTSGDSFHWKVTGVAGTLVAPDAHGTDFCSTSASVTYTPATTQAPGAVDTVTVDVSAVGGCPSGGLSLGTAQASISIQSNANFSIWRMKNIVINAQAATPNTQGASAMKIDLGQYQPVTGGTQEARLRFDPTELSQDFLPAGAPPLASSSTGPFPLAITGTLAVDDQRYAPAFVFTGSPPDNGLISGTYPIGLDACLGGVPDPLYLPYEAKQVHFQMNVTTGSGTIDYNYRDGQGCRLPSTSSWSMTVTFDADRIF